MKRGWFIKEKKFNVILSLKIFIKKGAFQLLQYYFVSFVRSNR